MAALALTGAEDAGWAKFSAHHARSRLKIDVEVGTADITASEPIYWIKRTIQKPGQKTQKAQVDTRSCPKMLAALRSLRDLPMPRPRLEGDELIVTADGTEYSLTIEVAYPGASPGDLTLTSNVDTPLAAWVEDALVTLESCLSK